MKRLLLPLVTSSLFLSCTSSPVSYQGGQATVNTTPIAQSPATVASGIRTFEVYKRSKAQVASAQVSRVGSRIKQVVPLSSAQWEFIMFSDSTPNAFALPGGKVGVHSGILPIAQNDAGMATIIAHEIAHVALNHHDKRKNRNALVGLGGTLLNTALGGGFGQLISTGGQLAINLPNSRSAEIEADQVGLIYMAKAGYDPREAIQFWQRFAEYKNNNQGRSGSAFFSTHPLDSTRIMRLQELLPLAIAEYNKIR